MAVTAWPPACPPGSPVRCAAGASRARARGPGAGAAPSQGHGQGAPSQAPQPMGLSGAGVSPGFSLQPAPVFYSSEYLRHLTTQRTGPGGRGERKETLGLHRLERGGRARPLGNVFCISRKGKV